MSGLSVNTPSTPRRKNCRISAFRSPIPFGSADERSSAGRNWFSRRNVYGWTWRPARARRGRSSSARPRSRRGCAGRCSPSTARRRRRSARCRAARPGSPSARRSAARRTASSRARRRAARAAPSAGAGAPCRLPDSNDCTNTGAPRRLRPLRLSVRDQLRLEREPEVAEVGRVLGLRVDADLAVQLLRQPRAQVEHLLERRDLELAVVPRVLRARLRDPLLGAQRLELLEREVLGEPAGGGTPSSSLVVLRSANSGWSATFVVPPISGSWRATSTPSLVETRSGSM